MIFYWTWGFSDLSLLGLKHDISNLLYRSCSYTYNGYLTMWIFKRKIKTPNIYYCNHGIYIPAITTGRWLINHYNDLVLEIDTRDGILFVEEDKLLELNECQK